MENIKISDSFDNMDPVEFDNIETGEKIKNEVSVKRIKEIAINSITGQVDLSDANKKDKSTKRMKIAIVISAAALLLSVSVYAIGSLGTFEIFFPDSMKVISGKSQNIFAKVEQNGVTMTMEKTINDGKSAVISYSFCKNDGSAFNNGLTSDGIRLTKTGTQDMGFINGDELLIDNNKKLVGFICPEEYSNIAGKDLTLSVTNLITRQKSDKEADYSLKELLDEKNGVNLLLLPDSVPGFALEEVKNIKGKVSFKTTFLQGLISDYKSYPHISYLKNIRTGDTIDSDTEGDFDISNVTDLSVWKPVVTYFKKDIVVSGTWNVPVKLESSDDFAGKNENITITRGDKNIVITKVSASMLGVYVEGYIEKKDGTKIPMTSTELDYTENLLNNVYVVLHNGQKQNIRYFTSASSSDPDLKNYSIMSKFYYTSSGSDKSNAHQRIFIDPKDISSVIIDGVDITLK